MEIRTVKFIVLFLSMLSVCAFVTPSQFQQLCFGENPNAEFLRFLNLVPGSAPATT